MNELFEAAVMLAASERRAFLAEVCGADLRLRVEVEALLAREPHLSSLGAVDRQRISGVFHAAFALAPADRLPFLEHACAGRPDDRREIESLLLHAEDSAFLEGPAAVTAGETRLESAPGGGDGSGASPTSAPPPGGRHDPFLGRKVRDYVILRKLGEGGMGVVYLALDTKLEKHVAIKVIRPEYASNADYRRRLVSEAQLAAKLSHANIATVHVLFEEGPDIFIVSEYVAGPSLREVVARGPLPYSRLVDMFTGIASGLEAAHARGIMHRDLKPDNILLTEEDVPKIVDFGLAKSTRAILSSTRMQTETGTHPGTPAYMAPEQIEEQPGHPLDFRCDHFSFGVTLYEAATGINPFEGRSLLTTLENIKRTDPPPLARPGLDLARLDAIVQRCLKKNPPDRYVSTKDLVRDLEQLKVTPVPTPSLLPIPPPSPRTWWEVHQLAVSAMYAVTLVYLWLVHPLAQPLWASRALMFAALADVPLLVGMRSHYLFASRVKLATLHRTRARYRRAVRLADWMFSAILAIEAALLLYANRPGTAAPLVILAAVSVVVFLVIEPAAEEDAFPRDPPAPPGPRPDADR